MPPTARDHGTDDFLETRRVSLTALSANLPVGAASTASRRAARQPEGSPTAVVLHEGQRMPEDQIEFVEITAENRTTYQANYGISASGWYWRRISGGQPSKWIGPQLRQSDAMVDARNARGRR
jgi:hypothetical protein